MQNAYFIKNPKSSGQLLTPRLVTDAMPWEAVKTITLGKIDYENFAGDMLVYRDFLENAEDRGAVDGVYHCLLIKCAGKPALLVVPDQDGYVLYAALAPTC